MFSFFYDDYDKLYNPHSSHNVDLFTPLIPPLLVLHDRENSYFCHLTRQIIKEKTFDDQDIMLEKRILKCQTPHTKGSLILSQRESGHMIVTNHPDWNKEKIQSFLLLLKKQITPVQCVNIDI